MPPRPPLPHPSPGVGLVHPLAPALEALLRHAVLEHVATERRRVFPPTLQLGVPGEGRTVLPDVGPRPDHALRTDLLEALFHHHHEGITGDGPAAPLLLWLTRPGDLGAEDDDLEWSSAARSAGSELGVALPMVVVTRQGWRDPRTGTQRTWRRLRPARR